MTKNNTIISGPSGKNVVLFGIDCLRLVTWRRLLLESDVTTYDCECDSEHDDHELDKTGLKDSPDCICGETESVRHYIEDCELYESVREKLRVRLFQSGGIFEFKASVFLEVLKEDPYEQERINIMSVLEDYIRETKRFEKIK